MRGETAAGAHLRQLAGRVGVAEEGRVGGRAVASAVLFTRTNSLSLLRTCACRSPEDPASIIHTHDIA